MDDMRKDQVLPVSETLEIVELDDRLDMAFDPIVALSVKPADNGNCGNCACHMRD
jgi:hypothetical protein